MQVLYGEGGASHTGPEACAAVREDRGEALTGESIGRHWSGETSFGGAIPFVLQKVIQRAL